MNFKRVAYCLVLLAVGFVVGYFSQPRLDVESSTTTIDSTRYVMPQKFEVKTTEIRTFNVPKLVFAPQDTTIKTIIKYVKEDGVKVEFPFERREYSDSTYRAVVSGVVVNNVHPTLEFLDIYSRTTTNTIFKSPPLFAPYVSASLGDGLIGIGGGVVIRGAHGIGLDYLNVSSESKLAFRYTRYF